MIQNEAMFKLSYGLFVLSANDGKDNACIINTAIQVTDSPKRISIAVNKANLTCEMIEKTNKFTVSVLSEKATFDIFKQFGFASGRDKDKFSDFYYYKHAENGTIYIVEYANAFVSCSVIEKIDCGTHMLFIADVTEAQVLSDDASMTYAYYFENVKPKPQSQKKKGYVCKICGYIYEGDELPEDFICPLCKHGASDFEPIE